MKALVVVCRFLGDTLLASPLARSLRDNGYTVDWLVAAGCKSIIEKQSFANNIYELEPTGHSFWKHLRQLYRGYDQAFILNASDRPMAITYFAAKETFALTSKRPQDFWKRALSKRWSSLQPDDHIITHAVDLGRMAHLDVGHEYGLEYTTTDLSKVEEILRWSVDDSYIVIHPFARWNYKLWPSENWKKLLELLSHKKIKVAVTCGPKEKESAENLGAHFSGNPDIQIIPPLSLSWPQIACLMDKAGCYVGLDTVNTHLAASTGTPTIALFGPTEPKLWAPMPVNTQLGRTPFHSWSPTGQQSSGNVTLIQGRQGCVPCHREGCFRHSHSSSDCLNSISVESVFRTIMEKLEKTS